MYGRYGGRNGVVVGHIQIDDQDYTLAARHRWHLGGRDRRFAMACMDGRSILIHRLLLGVGAGERVRHLNGDPLDNRRANLLVVKADDRRGIAELKIDPRAGGEQ